MFALYLRCVTYDTHMRFPYFPIARWPIVNWIRESAVSPVEYPMENGDEDEADE